MYCPCVVLSYYAVYMVPFMVRKAPYSVILSYYVVCMVSFVVRMAPYSVMKMASNSLSNFMRKKIKNSLVRSW